MLRACVTMFTLITTLLLTANHVALVSSRSTGETEVLEVRLQPLGAAQLAPVMGTISIVPGSGFAGAPLTGRSVAVSAQTVSMRDETWSHGLWLFDGTNEPRLLANRVAFGSRPMISRDGRVFVQRGTPGPEPRDDSFRRIDEVTVDEIDQHSGAARTLFKAQGFWAFTAGIIGDELLVFFNGPKGARIDAVKLDGGATRTVLGSVPGPAFDFTTDEKNRRLIFTLGDHRTGTWSVVSLAIENGELTTLHGSGSEVALLPTRFPDGSIAISDGHRGLVDAKTGVTLLPSLGAGHLRVRTFVGSTAIGLREAEGVFPTPFAYSLDAKRAVPLAFPKHVRLDIAGAWQ